MFDVKNGTALVGLVIALAAGAAITCVFTGEAASTPSVPTRSCAVTIPKPMPGRHGFGAAGFNYGSSRIRAHLFWPAGILTAGILPSGAAMAIINKDGSIYMKLGWWRGVDGRLRISGHRMDRAAPALRARVPTGYGIRGFQPAGITFPTIGCWQVVGMVQRQRLTFVVKVRKVNS